MTEPQQEKIFPSQMQDAIFQFTMSLIMQYRQTLSAKEAAQKAGDWLITLGNTIKREVEQTDSEYQRLTDPDSYKGN